MIKLDSLSPTLFVMLVATIFTQDLRVLLIVGVVAFFLISLLLNMQINSALSDLSTGQGDRLDQQHSGRDHPKHLTQHPAE